VIVAALIFGGILGLGAVLAFDRSPARPVTPIRLDTPSQPVPPMTTSTLPDPGVLPPPTLGPTTLPATLPSTLATILPSTLPPTTSARPDPPTPLPTAVDLGVDDDGPTGGDYEHPGADPDDDEGGDGVTSGDD
jgi:hypothetical protein